MKKILMALSLLFSLRSFALETPYIIPSVTNFGHALGVEVFNYFDRPIICSGPIHMYDVLGQRHFNYLYQEVMAQSHERYLVTPELGQGRIGSFSHSLFCY